MNILILGIGNPILGDDAVGIEIAKRIANKKLENVVVKETTSAGLEILETFVGYDKVIIIDGVKTGIKAPGSIYRLTPQDFKLTKRYSLHDINLLTALKVADRLDVKMPKIIIYGVEVKEIDKFKEGLSKKVEKSVSEVVKFLLEELGA